MVQNPEGFCRAKTSYQNAGSAFDLFKKWFKFNSDYFMSRL